eukprot:6207053-Pleurochrysis_carterae.AAC.1
MEEGTEEQEKEENVRKNEDTKKGKVTSREQCTMYRVDKTYVEEWTRLYFSVCSCGVERTAIHSMERPQIAR